jgi:ornithine cyclodeaminase/alanine dehydrogenase-like protein (mu-crystallin family)
MASSGGVVRGGVSLPWIDAAALLASVSVVEAIRLVDTAMRTVSEDGVAAPQRWTIPLSDNARLGLMPGAMQSIGRFGVKVLGLFEAAARGDRPSHQGLMLLFDLHDGRPLCVIDAAALTALRTAAATAVATRALARPGSTALALVGCGEQSHLHVEALLAIIPFTRLYLWNRTQAKAEAIALTCARQIEVEVCASPSDAVRRADVICTLTASHSPLLSGADIAPGQHLNLIGSSVDGPREVDSELVRRGRYYVDCRRHALSQAAELKRAIADNMVDETHVVGEIGEVLLGKVRGRRSDQEVTIYKSLGHIAQDLVVAHAAHAALVRPLIAPAVSAIHGNGAGALA